VCGVCVWCVCVVCVCVVCVCGVCVCVVCVCGVCVCVTVFSPHLLNHGSLLERYFRHQLDSLMMAPINFQNM